MEKRNYELCCIQIHRKEYTHVKIVLFTYKTVGSSNNIWNLFKARNSVDERRESGRWIFDNVCLCVDCELNHYRRIYSFVQRLCWQYLEAFQIVHFVHFIARAFISNQAVWNFSIYSISLHSTAILWSVGY
jgi:hypothetical protein